MHMTTCSQKMSFSVTAPKFARPQSFRMSSVGTVKTPVYPVPIANGQTPHQQIFNAHQNIRNRPGTFERA
jgi:hypothetical protein